jgi:hypothetical protein
LPWLEDNRDVLGFGEDKAQRLMKLANTALARDLDEAGALQISRETWGHPDGQRLTIKTQRVELPPPQKFTIRHKDEDKSMPQELIDLRLAVQEELRNRGSDANVVIFPDGTLGVWAFHDRRAATNQRAR